MYRISLILGLLLLCVTAHSQQFESFPLSFAPVAINDAGQVAGDIYPGPRPVRFDVTDHRVLSLPDFHEVGHVITIRPDGTVFGYSEHDGDRYGLEWDANRRLPPNFTLPDPGVFALDADARGRHLLDIRGAGFLTNVHVLHQVGTVPLPRVYRFLNERGMMASGREVLTAEGERVDVAAGLRLPGANVEIVGLNERGQALVNIRWEWGWFRRYGVYLWEEGRLLPVVSLTAEEVSGGGLNDAGEIVGTIGGKAFLWRDGDLRLLEELLTSIPIPLGEGVAINNGGWIVTRTEQRGHLLRLHQPHLIPEHVD